MTFKRRPVECDCATDHREIIQARITIAETGCWHWNSSINKVGYGVIRHHNSTWMAHRLSYYAHVGTFAAELDLDHLCKNRDCVNPAHLEPVTKSENMARSDNKTVRYQRNPVCDNGHALIPNRREGHNWRCPICKRDKQREWIKNNPPLEPGDPRHGSLYAWQRFHCRCDACVAAFRQRNREWYAKNAEKIRARKNARQAEKRRNP